MVIETLFTFSPNFKGRIFSNELERGDVIVFKTQQIKNYYIKRLIGLPGDKIQFIDSNLYLNNSEILKSRISKSDIIYCGQKTIDMYTLKNYLMEKNIIQFILKIFLFRILIYLKYLMIIIFSQVIIELLRIRFLSLVMFIKIIQQVKHNLFFFLQQKYW